jgi:hypothetical protein
MAAGATVQGSMASRGVVHQALQAFGVQNSYMTLFNFDSAFFYKFREGSAHGFELEA